MNDEDSEAALQPAAQPPQQSTLSELEEAVIRELRMEELLAVFARSKSNAKTAGSCGPASLAETLREVAPSTVARVWRALDSQYSTLEQSADATGATLVSNQELELSEEAAAAADAQIEELLGSAAARGASYEAILRMATVTPLRLSYEERFLLRLLEATLEVSEYTDKVDVLGRMSAAKRIARETREIFSILSGLVVANHYEAGQRLVTERNFESNAEFFKEVFEVGRRYKILNPERMRDSYGKLIFFLMDTRRLDVLQFDCVTNVKTVGSLLKHKTRGVELLSDPLLPLAIGEIIPTNKSREAVQAEIRRKEAARERLLNKYAVDCPNRASTGILSKITQSLFSRPAETAAAPTASSATLGTPPNPDMVREEVELCLYSLSDYNAFLRFNRDPVIKMIHYLKRYFTPDRPEPNYSLAIQAGNAGARLNHNHSRQYNFVWQSLTLWREVLGDMIPLWTLAEQDMLASGNHYRLCDTGQGLHRVQEAPLLYRAMSHIVARVQAETGGWCGSSAIHLGDHNVPNALVFIDKYIQVPRILGPLVLVLEKIPALYAETEGMKRYIDETFAGEEGLIKNILSDFFRHGFDGSGADNFFDAGSCIDGRLTSAWNWCSKIERKKYFPIFLLAGFQGFDGRF